MRNFITRLVLGSCAVWLPAATVAQQPASAYMDADAGITANKIVDLALSRNADMLAARQRSLEAQGLLLQSGFRPNPTVELSIANGALLKSPGEREYTLGYAHVFELGGKRERRVTAGRLAVDLAGLLIADRERQLKAGVRTRYGKTLAAVRNLESAERLLELNRQSLRIVEARTKEGEGAPLEQALLQVEVNRMQSDRLLFANQVDRALLELKTLAGMRLDEPLRLSGNLAAPTVTLQLADALTRALLQRPDLRAARLEEGLADADVQLARAEAVPNLVASGRYSRVSSRFDQFGLAGAGGPLVALRATDNLLAAGVSITLPTRNRNQGNIQAALARRQAARLRAQFLEQVVRQEVEAAYSRHEAARGARQLFDKGVVQQSEENVRVLRAAYDLGEIRLLDVISEQRRLVDTQKAYSEILRESYLALVDLERAVGRSPVLIGRGHAMDASNEFHPAAKGRGLAAALVFVVALAGAFLAGLMWRGTRSTAEPRQEARAEEKEAPADKATVTLDAETQRKVGLQLAPAEVKTLRQTIQATGSVGPNETRVAHIRPMARGQVKTVHVRLGDRVRAGQPLLVYDNIELGDAIGQYLSALATLERARSEADAAQRAAGRASNLVSLGAVAQAEYDRRAAEHKNALATVESQRADAARTEEKLHRFGMTDPEIGKLKPGADSQYHREASHTTLVAPFPGIVTGFRASPGESIGPDDELMTVADLSTVWVQADVYEKDIAMVRQGTAATVSVEAYPGRTFSGNITYVSDFLDPRTRTVKVRCEVPNLESLLKLDMFAAIGIPAPAGRSAVLISAAAIQQIDGQAVAFIKTGEAQFQKRPLKLGQRTNGWIEVADGIRPGEQVVTEGSFILKSEVKKAELGRHEE